MRDTNLTGAGAGEAAHGLAELPVAARVLEPEGGVVRVGAAVSGGRDRREVGGPEVVHELGATEETVADSDGTNTELEGAEGANIGRVHGGQVVVPGVNDSADSVDGALGFTNVGEGDQAGGDILAADGLQRSGAVGDEAELGALASEACLEGWKGVCRGEVTRGLLNLEQQDN